MFRIFFFFLDFSRISLNFLKYFLVFFRKYFLTKHFGNRRNFEIYFLKVKSLDFLGWSDWRRSRSQTGPRVRKSRAFGGSEEDGNCCPRFFSGQSHLSGAWKSSHLNNIPNSRGSLAMHLPYQSQFVLIFSMQD